jgi:hypothetical protein
MQYAAGNSYSADADADQYMHGGEDENFQLHTAYDSILYR